MSPDLERAHKRQAGTSLIELVVAIVVISISLTGMFLVIDTTTRRSADPMLERQAISIAEAYLTEALQKNFLDPDTTTLCPTPEAARALFDNVCDFDGLREIGARDQQGVPVAGLDAYRIQIDVDSAANLGGISGPTRVLRVDAAVTDPVGRVVRIAGYRTAQ